MIRVNSKKYIFSISLILIIGLMVCFYFSNKKVNKKEMVLKSDKIEKIENNVGNDRNLNRKLKIMIISDIHFFPFEFTSETDIYRENMPNDRKLLRQSEEISKEMMKRIKNSDVDLVFITGDLTKDGEKESHLRLAQYLKDVEKTGKRVYVIPGNHDVYNEKSVKFEGKNSVPVDNITPEDFKNIYADFGYNEAISKDEKSLSYIVEPVKGLKIVAIDSTKHGNENGKFYTKLGGSVNEEKLNWIKNQLSLVDKNKELILALMHHNLIEHFDYQNEYFENYTIDESESIKHEFADMGIRAVFTGHFHISDISKSITNRGNTIYDIETGSIITFPCPYRIVEIDRNQMNITTKRIDYVNFYGIGYDFQKYSYEYLLDGLGNLIHKMLNDYILRKKLDNDEVDYLLNRDITKDYTAEKLFIEAMMANYCGDEVMSSNQKKVIDILQNSDLKIYRSIGEIAKSLLTDKLPKDNECKIYFGKIN